MCLTSTAGCSPPFPFITNERITHHLNGSVGSVLTLHCHTGYRPYEPTMSMCLENPSWVPTPNCMLAGMTKRMLAFPFILHIIGLDCGTPIGSDRVVIEPFNSTLFNSMITFRCQDGLKPDTVSTAVCDRRGVWDPNPSHYLCVNQSGNDLPYRDSNVMIVSYNYDDV